VNESGLPPVDALLIAWRQRGLDDLASEFQLLDGGSAGELFLRLRTEERIELLRDLPDQERRVWVRLLPPDDIADLIQGAPTSDRARLLALLDSRTRSQVETLLAYRVDVAGGKMNPQFIRVPPELTVEQALAYMRLQAGEGTTRTLSTGSDTPAFYYAYVVDADGRLRGSISFRELILAAPDRLARDVMSDDVVSIRDDVDQEEIAQVLLERGLLAVPVVDAHGRMRGVVTIDDVIDVVREEATEDIHKLGGVTALEQSYFRTRPLSMLRKRAGWLSILFVSEMLTATAMGFFERDIEQAVVLAVFVPLIISSGGNSGSQAATLVIRAMALGEVRHRDWWRVVRREFGFGLVLGLILAVIGASRIFGWEVLFDSYGDRWFRLLLTVAMSVTAVVTWGTITGATLPFVLRRLGFDPATASAPFVATMVDVTGLIIYFSIARVVLLGV